MDALSLGTYYLTKRLNLSNPPSTIREELEKLFSKPNGSSPLHDLILRFNHNKQLVPILGAWLYGDDLTPLKNQDILIMFEIHSVEQMATRLSTTSAELIAACSEMIPAIIKRASLNGELESADVLRKNALN